MAREHSFAIVSALPTSPREVWLLIGTMRGVNAELAPLVRMTYLDTMGRLGAGAFPLGRRAFRSWLLLFGALPFDYDDMTLIELEPERGFLECSPMLTQQRWRRRRMLQPDAAGCVIADQVCFIPRLPLLGWVFQALFTLAFINRHRNLRRIFGQRGKAPRS